MSEMMRAIRLHAATGIDGLTLDTVELPEAKPGEVLVRVHAAALTRDELDWPTDRLPAIPSYELSGVVEATGGAVYGLTGFDRDGAAADYIAVPEGRLARKPDSLSHIEAAALPLAGLSAWQGLFTQGALEPGERVLILGAAGGVGHLATQLAIWRGAHVIGAAAGAGVASVEALGAHEAIEATPAALDTLDPVDLVFDTSGGELLAYSAAVLRHGGRLVSVAEEPPAAPGREIRTSYFVVEPDREQLEQLAQLAAEGAVRPAIDSTFALEQGMEAFRRLAERGKHGKVVLILDP